MIPNTRLNTAEILTLKSVKGIGAQSIRALAESSLTLEELIYSDPDTLSKWVKGSSKNAGINGIISLSNSDSDRFQETLTELEAKGVSVISFWDSNYPRLYRVLKNPPPLIYIRGNKTLLNFPKSVAIVGTRSNSKQAQQIALATAREFCKRDYLIVSGLALGIDTAGHLGALEVSGLTAAILVDILDIYPKENAGLAEQILEAGGILISENMPGEAFGKAAFVSRDRLQSGLSQGVFVIETSEKGGTMHTARFAQEQSRLVYCPDYSLVPDYDYDWERYSGIQQLLDQGLAKSYSAKDYDAIDRNLSEQQRKLQSSLSQISLFG